MAFTQQYTGSRYVPIFADPAEWNNVRTYEPLTIVLNEGNSYTSRQFVPAGIELTNENYWLETGNYNAQMEQYRQEVLSFRKISTGSIKAFNTVAEMQTDNDLYEGCVCRTLGFHVVDDNGGAYYIITKKQTPNAMDVLSCQNCLYAVLVIVSPLSFEMFGAYGDATHDDTNAVLQALSKQAEVYSIGSYSITKSLPINFNKNIHIHSIVYNGNDFAVTISHSIDNITIESISAPQGSGLTLGGTTYVDHSNITINAITASNYGIYFDGINGFYAQYNTFNNINVHAKDPLYVNVSAGWFNSNIFNNCVFTVYPDDNLDTHYGIHLESISVNLCETNIFNQSFCEGSKNGAYLKQTKGNVFYSPRTVELHTLGGTIFMLGSNARANKIYGAAELYLESIKMEEDSTGIYSNIFEGQLLRADGSQVATKVSLSNRGFHIYEGMPALGYAGSGSRSFGVNETIADDSFWNKGAGVTFGKYMLVEGNSTITFDPSVFNEAAINELHFVTYGMKEQPDTFNIVIQGITYENCKAPLGVAITSTGCRRIY